MSARLRPASTADALELAALHGAAFSQGWSADEISALLATPGGFGLVAVDGVEAAAGFLLARAAGGEAEILTLAVRPDLRRRGLGAALVATAAALAEAGGSSALFLEVATDNPAAIGLYLAAGFHRAGFRPAYYKREGAAADALVFRRDLQGDLTA
jgi:ribosomal-protein-alanine N-acetyltransferase